MQVKVVESRAERSVFVNLPWSLYSNDSLWVPPLKASVRQVLDSGKHPFYQEGGAEVELFLAWEGDRPVGRIAAIVNHEFNRFHVSNEVHFGFFECIDSVQAARALFEAVENWTRKRGSEAVSGPFNPSTNYECGLLVDGFDRSPVVMMTYNPRYYPDLVEGADDALGVELRAAVATEPLAHGAVGTADGAEDRLGVGHAGDQMITRAPGGGE